MNESANLDSLTTELARAINSIIPADKRRIVVGYSGGRDSHVLLHALATLQSLGQLPYELAAIHVNHRLQSNSSEWVKHCRVICADLSIPLLIETVSEKPTTGESIEQFARNARYELIKQHLSAQDVFVSGHHQRDQAETFLLQLMRGSGLDGLLAMPVIRPFDVSKAFSKIPQALYFRPFLNIPASDITHYAKQFNLEFIEDESNQDCRFDRNYIRHEVLPVLGKRFPHAEQAIGQSIEWLRELESHSALAQLQLDELSKYPFDIRKQMIRSHLKSKLGYTLSRHQTDYVLTHFFTAGKDKHPIVELKHHVIRRYQGEIIVTAKLPTDNESFLPQTALSVGQNYSTPVGTLTWQTSSGGLDLHLNEKLQVRRLDSGLKFRPHNRQHHQTIKKLLWEHQIPPWLRQYLPGLYLQGHLVAVPGIGVAHDYYSNAPVACIPCWQVKQKFVKL